MLEPFLALPLRPAGANLGRRDPHLLRRRDVDLDRRPVAEGHEHGGPLNQRNVELADLARLAVALPLKRRKRQVFGDFDETEVATP